MKKRDLIKQLRKIARSADMDFEFVREGGSHEIWSLGDERIVIPRHRETNERLAKGIIAKAKEVTHNDE